jgi:DNA-binding transcriptional LysR family regulator
MDIRQLQHFVAVTEEMHFTRAARRMNIVQSALSASIRALEHELGAALFQRTTRGVRITPEGEALYEKARVVLAAAREAREAVAATRNLERGRLTIGSVQSLPAFLDLPTLLGQFHALYPGIEVRLRQGERQHLVDQVADGRLNLAVLPAIEMPTGLGADVVADEPMVLVCPEGHPLARRARVSVVQLAGQTFVDFQPGWGTRGQVDRWFAEAGVKRHVAFEVNTLDTLLALVQRNMGLAIAPESKARAVRPRLGAVRLTGAPLRWKMLAVYVAGADGLPQAPVTRAFKAVLDAGAAKTG